MRPTPSWQEGWYVDRAGKVLLIHYQRSGLPLDPPMYLIRENEKLVVMGLQLFTDEAAANKVAALRRRQQKAKHL